MSNLVKYRRLLVRLQNYKLSTCDEPLSFFNVLLLSSGAITVLQLLILNFLIIFFVYFFFLKDEYSFLILIRLNFKKVIYQPQIHHLKYVYCIFFELYNHFFIIFGICKIIHAKKTMRVLLVPQVLTYSIDSMQLLLKPWLVKQLSILLHQAHRDCFNLYMALFSFNTFLMNWSHLLIVY